jgi:hypothetical protein
MKGLLGKVEELLGEIVPLIGVVVVKKDRKSRISKIYEQVQQMSSIIKGTS